MTAVLEANAPLQLHIPPTLRVSDEEFFAFCRQNPTLQIERSAKGDWIIMAPSGGETGGRNSELARQLGNWARTDGTGVVFDSSTGFVLPNGATRSPDASWVLRSRLARLTPEEKQRFLPLCPDFVVELRSPTDSLATLQEKMEEYIATGARLGWLLDPISAPRPLTVYRPNVTPEILDEPATVTADPSVMPGFTLDLTDIWTPPF